MNTTEIVEKIVAYGHKNIIATHKTTFEITKEDNLSKRGDCIIAVAADKAITDLNPKFREKIRKENAKMTILIEAGDTFEIIKAYGTAQLNLMHKTDIVVRKSDYLCGRTLAIKADKAACDFSREFVDKLKIPKQELKITLRIY